MSYSVKLNDESSREISGWSLSSHVIREILKGLDVLGSNPNRHLVRIGPPVDALQYDLIVRESGDPILDHLFVFTVFHDSDEETLHAVHCDHHVEPRLD